MMDCEFEGSMDFNKLKRVQFLGRAISLYGTLFKEALWCKFLRRSCDCNLSSITPKEMLINKKKITQYSK